MFPLIDLLDSGMYLDMNTKIVAVLLVCLILLLSIFDAPEYVRCVDIGICEFLENSGVTDYFSSFLKRLYLIITSNFYSLLENIVESKECLQDIIATCLSVFVVSFLISFVLNKKPDGITACQQHLYSSTTKVVTISRHTATLVGISIIRS